MSKKRKEPEGGFGLGEHIDLTEGANRRPYTALESHAILGLLLACHGEHHYFTMTRFLSDVFDRWSVLVVHKRMLGVRVTPGEEAHHSDKVLFRHVWALFTDYNPTRDVIMNDRSREGYDISYFEARLLRAWQTSKKENKLPLERLAMLLGRATTTEMELFLKGDVPPLALDAQAAARGARFDKNALAAEVRKFVALGDAALEDYDGVGVHLLALYQDIIKHGRGE